MQLSIRPIFRPLSRSVFAMLLLATTAVAAESPTSLSRKLQDTVLSGAGVQMSFTLSGQGAIKVTADLKNRRVCLEGPGVTILSDGSTVWNINKNSSRVTIDNVAGTSSPLKDPESLFRFADNYTSTITSNKGSAYTLELTPNAQLASVLKSAGNLQKLILSVKASGKTVKIQKATAMTSQGATHAGALSIKSLKSVKASDFVFKPTTGMKIIDLRE